MMITEKELKNLLREYFRITFLKDKTEEEEIQLIKDMGKILSLNESFEKLPIEVQKKIETLIMKYDLDITDDHIKKEFEIEGNYRPDAGRVNSQAKAQVKKLTNAAIKKWASKYPEIKKRPIISGYRSYDTQARNFGRKAKKRGIDDTQKANTLPGFSQHHTGKAFDVFSVESDWWEERPDFRDWIAENAPKYGFEVTYKDANSGRIVEPWHLYYTG